MWSDEHEHPQELKFYHLSGASTSPEKHPQGNWNLEPDPWWNYKNNNIADYVACIWLTSSWKKVITMYDDTRIVKVLGFLSFTTCFWCSLRTPAPGDNHKAPGLSVLNIIMVETLQTQNGKSYFPYIRTSYWMANHIFSVLASINHNPALTAIHSQEVFYQKGKKSRFIHS